MQNNMQGVQVISGKIVDVVLRTITKGIITIEKGRIKDIVPADVVDNQYLIPGLVDAHIHIESSMMLPAEFARYSIIHGTVACVCDPHEIANVCGIEGVDYMIENGKQSPMKFYFGAPSCVPSTKFETSGAELDAVEVEKLLKEIGASDPSHLGKAMGAVMKALKGKGDGNIIQKLVKSKLGIN